MFEYNFAMAEYEKRQENFQFDFTKSGFPLDDFVRANREKSNLIGWRQTLTSSSANHIRFLHVRANKFAKWKTGLNSAGQLWVIPLQFY